jgi:O-antigen ligase
MTTILLALLYLTLAVWLAAKFPVASLVVWLVTLETTPEFWLGALTAPLAGAGAQEAIIAGVKAAGLGLVLLTGVRFGWRADPWNPGFAFALMFATGLVHGLWPGLSLAESIRSAIGSAAPFAFSFVALPSEARRAITRAVIVGPALSVGFGLALQAAGLWQAYGFELGALRLAGAGQPAFLGGFALVGVYAGALAYARDGRRREIAWIAANMLILLLTGARAPLALGAAVALGAVLLLPLPLGAGRHRKAALIAGLVMLGALVVPFAASLHIIRAVNLTELGEAAALSHRPLIWPPFVEAIRASPVVGWGVGAGKDIVPLASPLARLIGTNAAHDEYLRIAAEGGIAGLALLIISISLWAIRGTRSLPRPERMLARLVFLAFAVHSVTDNTLIATTSSAMFIWASALFADANEVPSRIEFEPPDQGLGIEA